MPDVPNIHHRRSFTHRPQPPFCIPLLTMAAAGAQQHDGGGAAAVAGTSYPPPLAPHDQIVADGELFAAALRSFHDAMSTKFMVPVIGGRDLDLHLLYVEVTNRGGIEKVIMERRWREVISAFKFPATTTSASFVLRKYYLALLYHFEQVHFFGAKGPIISPSDALKTKTYLAGAGDLAPAKPRKRPRRSASESPFWVNGHSGSYSNPGSAGGAYNFTVTGTIDGKFELGYFVTVVIGAQTLKGVLYHTAKQPGGAASSSFPATAVAGCVDGGGGEVLPEEGRTYRRRRKRWCRVRDPEHPKPNRSAYNFFFKEKHSELKVEFPQREREFSKMIGESWSKLSDQERLVYQDIGRKDKERYKREMQEYRGRMNPGGHASLVAGASEAVAAVNSAAVVVQNQLGLPAIAEELPSQLVAVQNQLGLPEMASELPMLAEESQDLASELDNLQPTLYYMP